MSYSFTVAPSQPGPDFTNRSFVCYAAVTVNTGSYPTGGVGPIGLQTAYNVASSAGPIYTNAVSTGNSAGSPPDAPTGYVWQYDAATDKLRCMVTGAASGDALQEFSGTIAQDVIQVVQVFNRY